MSWLKKFFGKRFKELSPQVIEEGEKFAVVQITSTSVPRGFSSIGFILVNKVGNYGVTPSLSLHEGPLNEKARKRMQDALKKQESQ